jgi:uncharacterized protein with FMN-binding domain
MPARTCEWLRYEIVSRICSKVDAINGITTSHEGLCAVNRYVLGLVK